MIDKSLHEIIEKNEDSENFYKELKKALEHGADPNKLDKDGNSPLYNVIHHVSPNIDIVTLLIEHGC